MKKITWYLNRLKAMNMGEICWRFQQKNLQKQERRKYYKENLPVYEFELPDELKNLNTQVDRISINWNNEKFTVFKEQNLFGVYSYNKYKRAWDAGFQTENVWPTDQCSYDISISQREDIGDIRTNWELNRHYQFAGMAKSFYVTGDFSILEELQELFYDWNNKNHFLCGVEWTSAMEIAIRVNSWIYTYCFLNKAFEKYNLENNKILKDISRGIIVMADYIVKHRAKYSSANNHLIVEMYAVGMSGIFFDYKPWEKLAFNILTEELPRQNYADGVNKEMSLHYQSFVMEAYGLLMLEMKHNHIKIPQIWEEYLLNMSEFMCDCCGEYGETVVFGDNDEGKILDLSGEHFDHYRYVLDLMGSVLPKRYSKMENIHENLCWILEEDSQDSVLQKHCYYSPEVKCYKEGGYTLWRSKNNKVLIGIDHADLGFGSLAAHGHADALSFQMFIEGTPVFVDPGTYNYHVPKKTRDEFRATKNHNTVCVDGENQAEILGPFLWGNRYRNRDVSLMERDDEIEIQMKIKYGNKIYRRIMKLSQTDKIRINILDTLDCTSKMNKIEQVFMLGTKCSIKDSQIECGQAILKVDTNTKTEIKKAIYSSAYNTIEDTKKMICYVNDQAREHVEIKTTIMVEENENIKN